MLGGQWGVGMSPSIESHLIVILSCKLFLKYEITYIFMNFPGLIVGLRTPPSNVVVIL